MKLRNGWKSHGGSWHYKENPITGMSVVSVVQITVRGEKRFEAHYWDDRIPGFAELSDYWRTKIFEDRKEAFIFCEKMHEYCLERKSKKRCG